MNIGSVKMRIKSKRVGSYGIRFSVESEGKEIARAFLYIMKNDLHEEPFGLIEDVFVDKSFRGGGIGKNLIKRLIEEARNQKCYKVICTSRYSNERVHKLYEEIGFKRHGTEFRIDL